MRQIVIATLFFATSIPAHSEAPFYTNDGNRLYEQCKAKVEEHPYQIGMCQGYITATVDALTWQEFCPPIRSTYGQDVEIVRAGLAAHPETRHEPSTILIRRYLRAAWPCQKVPAK